MGIQCITCFIFLVFSFFAFVEPSLNAVLSRVLWSDVMVGCIKVAHDLATPQQGRNELHHRQTNLCCKFLWSAESLFCKVRVFEL